MCDHNPTAVAHPDRTVLQVLPLLSQAAVGLYMGREKRLRKRTQQQRDYKPQGETQRNVSLYSSSISSTSPSGGHCAGYIRCALIPFTWAQYQVLSLKSYLCHGTYQQTEHPSSPGPSTVGQVFCLLLWIDLELHRLNF